LNGTREDCGRAYTAGCPISEQLAMDMGKTIYFETCTDKKENQIFLIYKEIQNGAVAKSYSR
jgi:hypothetical protein